MNVYSPQRNTATLERLYKESMCDSLDKGKVDSVVFFHPQKPFDTVEPDLSKRKTLSIGIYPHCILVFERYLQGQTQFRKIN